MKLKNEDLSGFEQKKRQHREKLLEKLNVCDHLETHRPAVEKLCQSELDGD